MTHIIQIGRRYFSARRGHFGGLVCRDQATLFTESDARQRAACMAGAVAVLA